VDSSTNTAGLHEPRLRTPHGLLPNARLTIYPDSAHGFLFQHHSQFAADVHVFLEEAD